MPRPITVDESILDTFLANGGQIIADTTGRAVDATAHAITPPATNGQAATNDDQAGAAREPAGVSPDETAQTGGRSRPRAALNYAGAQAGRFHDWMAAQPTPGGIALLLFVLIFFVWAIVPVSKQGYTRLQLLWMTVTGRTTLRGHLDPNAPAMPGINDPTVPVNPGGTSGFGTVDAGTTGAGSNTFEGSTGF